MCKNKFVEKYGLDQTFLQVLEQTLSGRRIFVGFTCATLIDNVGDTYSYNAHPYYLEAPWYDWAYIYYVIKEDGESKAKHYPSKILGFIQDGEDVNAVVQCDNDPVPWLKLEEEYIAKF